jgi:hypothetical protein
LGGFLVDEDSLVALHFSKRARRAEDHTDPEIIRAARKECRTIITSNAWDFVRYIKDEQNPPSYPDCQDAWGLVVIPSREFTWISQRERIRYGLVVPGIEVLRWPAIGFLNLWITLPDQGRPSVKRFERCPFCTKTYPIPKRWKDWYYGLEEVKVVGA